MRPLHVLSAALLTAAPAFAQESDSTAAPRYRLDPVVVTGERLPVPLARVPLDLMVLGRDRIETARPLFLHELLREVPALDVQRSGNLGKLTDVRLRGADPRHVLVLFDGIPLNGPWLGSFDFADLMDPGLDRIEVLGGPASSLYGSGAVGGVIQFLTFPAEPRAAESAGAAGDGLLGGSLRAFAEYGEEATTRQGVRWEGRAGGPFVGFSATRLTTDGAFARDGYRGLNGNLRLEVPVGDHDRFRMSTIATEGRKELPFDFFTDFADTTLSPFGSFKQFRDPNNDEEDRLLAGIAVWTRRLGGSAEIEGEISGSSSRIRIENEPNGGGDTDFRVTDLKSARGSAGARLRFTQGASLQMVAGADYRGDQAERDDAFNFGGFSDTTRVDKGIHARALYVQAHGEWRGRWLADAGLRVEDHSKYGSYGVPRLALGFDWGEAGLKLRGGYGRAFSAPTLTDLYYPGFSSESLRPERSTTWEVGADGRWLGGRVAAHATYHRTRFRDLIQSSSFFTPGNVGEARIEGEELSVRWEPDARIRLGGSAAHLIAKKLTEADPDPDRRLAKRPAWRFVLTGEAKPLRDVTLTAAWRWVDPVRDPFVFIDADGRVLSGDTPGYASLDGGASFDLRRWAPLELHVRITNALDRDYSEVKGFPARGRVAAVGLTFLR